MKALKLVLPTLSLHLNKLHRLVDQREINDAILCVFLALEREFIYQLIIYHIVN